MCSQGLGDRGPFSRAGEHPGDPDQAIILRRKACVSKIIMLLLATGRGSIFTGEEDTKDQDSGGPEWEKIKSEIGNCLELQWIFANQQICCNCPKQSAASSRSPDGVYQNSHALSDLFVAIGYP